MARYLDKNGEYVGPAEHFGYEADHTIDNQATEWRFCEYLNLECDFDELSEDAQDAYGEWFSDMTELDYENGNRYWLDLDEEREGELFSTYVPRIWDDDGNPRRA